MRIKLNLIIETLEAEELFFQYFPLVIVLFFPHFLLLALQSQDLETLLGLLVLLHLFQANSHLVKALLVLELLQAGPGVRKGL